MGPLAAPVASCASASPSSASARRPFIPSDVPFGTSHCQRRTCSSNAGALPILDPGGSMSQFLEVIEWVDGAGTEIVHRVPDVGSAETKLGAQLVVRDSQAAIFFRSGRGLDVFGPGRHTLTTANLPVLTKLLALPW